MILWSTTAHLMSQEAITETEQIDYQSRVLQGHCLSDSFHLISKPTILPTQNNQWLQNAQTENLKHRHFTAFLCGQSRHTPKI